MSKIWIPTFLFLFLALSACSTATVKGSFDTAGKTLKTAVCGMSLGAYYRINTGAERAALTTLCDPHQ